MQERLKAAARILLHGVIWVFVLSIRVDGRPLFHHAHNVLVDNQVVAGIQSEAARGFRAVRELAASGFTHVQERLGQGLGGATGQDRG